MLTNLSFLILMSSAIAFAADFNYAKPLSDISSEILKSRHEEQRKNKEYMEGHLCDQNPAPFNQRHSDCTQLNGNDLYAPVAAPGSNAPTSRINEFGTYRGGVRSLEPQKR